MMSIYPYRNWVSNLGAALTLALMGAAWLIFAPIQFGGQAGYVIVSGNSMEPGLHRGDLVVLRERPDYQIGDVVTYRHPTIGPVIHRIIDRSGDRFVFKGDNNSWIDAYQPTQAELIGTLWIYLPSIGKIVDKLRTPHYMALLAGALGFIVMVPFISSENQRRPRRQRRPALLTVRFVVGGRTDRSAPRHDSPAKDRQLSRSALAENRDSLIFALGTLTFASLLLALFVFTRPTTRAVADDLTYQQTGVFEYTAAAPAGIYDSDTAQTGQPVYRKLTSSINVQFGYHLVTELPSDVQGSYRLVAEIGDTGSWKRTIEIQPKTGFSGGAFPTNGTIDLNQVQELIDRFEQQTGLQRQEYTLAVVPLVTTQGSVAGQELQDDFSPRLTFRLDQLQLQLLQGSGTTADALRPSKQGLLKRARTVPNTISLLGLTFAIAPARWLALSGLALGLAGALAVGLPMLRAGQADEATRIRLKYGALLVAAQAMTFKADDRVIDVATIEDLAKLAERESRMILHEHRDKADRYFVQDGDVTYRYQIVDLDDTIRASTEHGAA
jgi:signal peptidase I